jgi:MarR family 2-MHQ and catechol resistance regulon transcriptional repressor
MGAGTGPRVTKAMPEIYRKALRTLVETYFAFLDKDAAVARANGLTSSQFDVIATLGNTPGMTCRELSEKTLVTKGTLTGVLDRLQARGLVRRSPSRTDRRSIHVQLTARGDELFRRVFPRAVATLRPYFERALDARQAETLRDLLARLRDSFQAPMEGHRKENA